MVCFKCFISRISDLNGDDDDKTNEERCFQNSTYDDTNISIAQPYEIALGPVGSLVNEKFPETAYDSINLPIQPTADNGQMYDVLNRSRANGMCMHLYGPTRCIDGTVYG